MASETRFGGGQGAEVIFVKNKINFEWDEDKAVSNMVKHGIKFERACEVFFDPYCRLLDVSKDDRGETRDGMIGYTEDGQMLYVVHVKRYENEYRIISARSSTSTERRIYEGE